MLKPRKKGVKFSFDLEKWKEYLNRLSNKKEFERWYEEYCEELDQKNLPPPDPPSLFLPEKSKRKGLRNKLPDPRITKAPAQFYREAIVKGAIELLNDPQRFLYVLKRRRGIFNNHPNFGFAIHILSQISYDGGRQATPANKLLNRAGLSHFQYPFRKGRGPLRYESLWYYKEYPVPR